MNDNNLPQKDLIKKNVKSYNWYVSWKAYGSFNNLYFKNI